MSGIPPIAVDRTTPGYFRGREVVLSVLAMVLMVVLAISEHHLSAAVALAEAQAASAAASAVETRADANSADTDSMVVNGHESAYARSKALAARCRLESDAVLAAMCVVVLLEILLVVRPMHHELERARTAVRAAVRLDVATSCLNRDAFNAEGAREFARARRFGFYFSLVMMDLDGLKTINERYGHAGGDAAISAMATMLHMHARGTDLLGRMDGGAFGILMPHTSSHQARLGAERIQEAIAKHVVMVGKEEFPVTVSVGIAMLREWDKNVFDVYGRAERGLLKAKASGSGAVVVEE